jgi:hypothetical protein
MALSTEHKIYAGLAILAVLGGAVYMNQQKQKDEAKRYSPGAASANLPAIKLAAEDADKLTKITLQNEDKTDIVLEKKDDKWVLTKPVEYAANQGNVKSLVDNLKELKLKEQIETGAGSYKDYGLEDGKTVHVVAYKGNDKVIDLQFGKSGGRGQMVRKTGVDGVFAATGYSPFLYTRDAKALRNNEILKFDDAAVTQVNLTNENGDFVFKKEGEGWKGTLKDKAIDRFDDAKVKDLVRAYKSLTAEDYADGKSEADTGLDKPAATLVFTRKEGDPVKVELGKTSSGESRYLRTPGTPQVFTISSWAAGWGVAKAEKFQKPEEKKDKDKKDGAGGAAAAGSAKKIVPPAP